MKRLATVLLSGIALAACGGGGGGGSSSGGSSGGGGTPVNRAPNAAAGIDQNLALGATATLNASASTDPDGDSLTYTWAITGRPAGSNAALSSNTGANITISPDIAGSYSIELTASDGSLTDTDTVQVTVAAPTGVAHDAKVTTGVALASTANLFNQGQRVTRLGTIADADGIVWTVPADVNFTDTLFPFASDLHNVYVNGHSYANDAAALAALSTNDIVEIDSAGKIVTAYIYADNYFELSINGTPVGKDAVPFTDFNSAIAQFKVELPFTAALLAVD